MKIQLAPDLSAAVRRRWEPVYRSRCNYLVTWSTRGHKPVLKERHARRLLELVPGICEERGFSLLQTAVAQDHVHALIGLKPAQSVAGAVREIKGRVGLALLADHPELRVWLGGNLLWDERYAVETVSHARLPRVQEKLRLSHAWPEALARAG